MSMQTNGVFGPDELNFMQDLFDDAWATLAKSQLPADTADEQSAKARLGRIVLRIYSGNGQCDGATRAAVSRYRNTDIRVYLVRGGETHRRSEKSR
jgi:predicted GNAT superfamily acetyltransferase